MTSYDLETVLHRYQHLLQQIELAFEDLKSQYPADLNCRAGCHQCCLPGLSVSKLEALSIQAFLTENPERLTELRHLSAEDPHRQQRCSLLDGDGHCGIYEVRPVICRSHGAPILFQQLDDAGQQAWYADVCELNFHSTALESIPQEEFLLIDVINQHLARLNLSLGFSAERTALSVAALTQGGGHNED